MQYIFVKVELPHYGKMELPLRISPKNVACVVYKDLCYEIFQREPRAYQSQECEGYFTKDHINSGNVQVSLAKRYALSYSLKANKEVPSINEKNTIEAERENRKSPQIRLSGKFQ